MVQLFFHDRGGRDVKGCVKYAPLDEVRSFYVMASAVGVFRAWLSLFPLFLASARAFVAGEQGGHQGAGDRA